ncbi:MAG: NDP-sugar synthase, partial [Methanomassiliicoccales archaeon]|nr:NDP-sugar synthase [Methanomassiliicoccales archaeon]
QAIVLVGGEGTRLRPLTNNRPKPLLPVLGRPCVDYTLHALASAGVEQVILACGYRSEAIERAVGRGEGFGVDVVFAYEEEPMGTAGAVKLLEERLDKTFVVVMGDTLMDIDLGKVIASHLRNKAMVTIALTEVEKPTEFGIVGLDESCRIIRFKEKPKPEEVFSNLVNAGAYVMQRDALAYIPEATKFDFSKNLFPKLLEEGHSLFGSRLTGMWKDIGRPADLLDANLKMAERKGTEMKVAGAQVEGKLVGAGFRAEGARLIGPSYLGIKAVVGHGAVVNGSVIGDRCSVGEGARVEGSLLMNGCVIGPNARLKGCILGEGCKVGESSVLVDCVVADGREIEPCKTLSSATLD